MAPRLAVLIPLFDSAATVERTLRSLECVEDPGGLEVVVVDDGSHDDGAARARALLAGAGHGAVKVVAQENAGSGAARNRALAESTAEWVLFLDADDELASDAFALLERAPADATAVLAATVTERDGRTLLRRRPPRLDARSARRALSAGNPLPVCSLLLRRSALEHGFDTGLRYLEDWDLFLRNPGLFARAFRAPDVVLARIHVHAGNKSARYGPIGAAREAIARAHLERGAAGMGLVERNNWRLQRAIGKRLQGRGVEWARLLSWPCSPVLFAKFLAHAVLGRRLLAHDPYAPGR